MSETVTTRYRKSQKPCLDSKVLFVLAFSLCLFFTFGCTSYAASPAPSVTFRFAVTDDSRAAGGVAAVKDGVAFVALNAIAQDMATQKVDLVLFPGDMVLGTTDNEKALDTMFAAWKMAMAPLYDARIPVYVTRGNHEYNPRQHGSRNPDDANRISYLAHFSMPNNGPAGEVGLTYSFTYKNATFIAFDQYAGRTESFDNTRFAPGSNRGEMMNRWVLDQLRRTSSGVTFVMAHEMMAPSASHNDCLANDPDSRDALIHALSARHGAYFSGHDHLYLRGMMTSGTDRVPALVVGTAGAANYDYLPFDPAAKGYQGPAHYRVDKAIADRGDPVFGYLLVTVYSDNSWSGQFRGFRFRKWNDFFDVSLTPMTVLDAFKSSDLYRPKAAGER